MLLLCEIKYLYYKYYCYYYYCCCYYCCYHYYYYYYYLYYYVKHIANRCLRTEGDWSDISRINMKSRFIGFIPLTNHPLVEFTLC